MKKMKMEVDFDFTVIFQSAKGATHWTSSGWTKLGNAWYKLGTCCEKVSIHASTKISLTRNTGNQRHYVSSLKNDHGSAILKVWSKTNENILFHIGLNLLWVIILIHCSHIHNLGWIIHPQIKFWNKGEGIPLLEGFNRL